MAVPGFTAKAALIRARERYVPQQDEVSAFDDFAVDVPRELAGRCFRIPTCRKWICDPVSRDCGWILGCWRTFCIGG